MMPGKIHWREDIKEMSFEDFYSFHSYLFVDESEAKDVYKEVTGKNPEKKVVKKKDE